jgi:hypothetical protein
MTQPLLYVAPPVVEPYRYGLFGAAQPINDEDVHWQLGIEWEPLACYAGNFYLAGLRCSTGVLAPPSGLAAAAVVGGGTFVGGGAYWVITGINAAGETTRSTEATAVIAVNGSANLTWAPLPAGTTGVKVYRGTVAGAENVLVATLGAVTAYTDTGSAGSAAVPPANNTATTDPQKALPSGAATTKAHPFAVYAGMECGSVGYDHEGAYQERARTILELAGQHAAESALWTGAGGNTGPMNAAATPIVSASPTSLTAAVGALEDWLADHYSGVGVIHAKRGVNAFARRAHLTVRDPGNPEALTTGLGTRWVFGGGYNGTGPAAVAPAANQGWIYATGQLTIRRGPVTAFTMAEALNRSINDVSVFAEQPYVVGFDCAIGAALVDFTL